MTASRARQTVEVGGREVSLSNLDKALYPSGFTKGQVIDYYIRVSDYLLPHLKGRPVTLKRYPNGVTGKHFYEKDAPDYTPEWVRTFDVPRRSGDAAIHYVVLDDLPSLVWAANLANLEIHPFLHSAPRIDRPTSLVFDLDPGDGADVLTCVEVAFLLKERLEAAGLKSFGKVSGSKGLQLYAPLNAAATYAATQPFARGLAEEMEREHPDLVVSAMAKAKRHGKVFIDWSQNSDFKTTVCVYSLRAKQAMPYVSLPFAWDELRAALKKRDAASLYFEPERALARIARSGDLFAGVLSLKQKLPKLRGAAPGRSARQRTGGSAAPDLS
jgi:bifunctional non-homologous end joining protein LigD